MWCGMHYHCMTSFMIGNCTAFTFLHDPIFLLDTADQVFFHGFLEILHGDNVVSTADCQNGRFIDDASQVRAYQSWCGFCDVHQVHIRSKTPILDMYFQNRQPSFHIGTRDVDMAVESTWSSESRVKYIHTIGGAQHHYSVTGCKTVHLHQQLVQSLILLHFTSPTSRVAFASSGINFINKNNTRGFGAGLLKQRSYPAGAYTYKNFNEFGPGGSKEGYACLACNRFGHQGLARAWVSYQQHATRHTCTHTLVHFVVF